MAADDTQVLRSDAQANQGRILVAARTVFAERGLDAKLSDIADAAGVGVGTIYRRFGSKEGLIQALFAARLHAMVSVAEAAVGVGDPWEGLTQFLVEGSRMMAADHALRELLIPSGAPSNPLTLLTSLGDDVLAVRSTMIELTDRIVARARDSGALRDDFQATDIPILLLAIQAGSDFARPHSDEMWQRILVLVLDGMRAERPGRSDLRVRALTPGQLDAAILQK